MLTRLAVENYALIDSLEIEFDAHLNIITGETGAGKSILMGALSLLLGAKNDGAAIKDSARSCIVEAEFDVEGLSLEEFFAEHDLEYDTHTIIRRTISPSGRSRVFINDQPVQLTELKEVGAYLIDIHSQHQNLILQSAAFRTKALDTAAGNEALLAEYRTVFTELGSQRAALEALRTEVEQSRQEEEWLRHQVEELTAASLREGEVEEAEAEQLVLENADAINEALGRIHAILDEESIGVLTSLKEAESALRHVAGNYAAATELIERIHSSTVELRDIDATIVGQSEHIESNPERLDKLNERLNLLSSLCTKHRVDSITALIALRDDYASRLDTIIHGDEQLSKIALRVAESEERAYRLAAALHKARAAAAPKLSQAVVDILRRVGMVDAQFDIRLTEGELTAAGCDTVEFVFSANANVEPRAIEKIASGGELSRVMLALKTTLAHHLALPTIIFDEIDTGISGRTANAVGDIISEAAEAMQVINITHLPQVASKGNKHLLVYKEQSVTHIRPLAAEERVVEIAKMLSGDTITEAALAQARNLLSR